MRKTWWTAPAVILKRGGGTRLRDTSVIEYTVLLQLQLQETVCLIIVIMSLCLVTGSLQASALLAVAATLTIENISGHAAFKNMCLLLIDRCRRVF